MNPTLLLATPATYYLLLTAYCLLLTTYCTLLTAYYLQLTAHCLLLTAYIPFCMKLLCRIGTLSPKNVKSAIAPHLFQTRNCRHAACTTHCSLLTAHYSLLTAHYSLLTTHYSLLTTHYPLVAAQDLLLTSPYVYYSPPTRACHALHGGVQMESYQSAGWERGHVQQTQMTW